MKEVNSPTSPTMHQLKRRSRLRVASSAMAALEMLWKMGGQKSTEGCGGDARIVSKK